ncbi:hypothetical protein L596_009299 [Steinernema carpocapsae]|uniref:Saposin B-type domain-containing protein n=1 Tax=Steinernema carpocapsae TaxID=34508 RepID=A0A4U5PFH1_STECR|nr:hypothetical protein L596_009299 [Steinernema carpocapsae]
MFGLLIVFALLFVPISANQACDNCKLLFNFAYQFGIRGALQNMDKFKGFYNNECQYFERQIDGAVGKFCFELYSKNQHKLLSDFKAVTPVGIMCTDLKQC